MINFTRLKDCVVTNKNVLLRVDINVPIINGKITDDTRIKAIIPTLKYLLQNQAKVILISHFGRPEGKFISEMSLEPLIPIIGKNLDGKVKINFIDDCVGEKVQEAVSKTNYGEIILLENLRFYKEETKNDPEFARKLAALGNLYVNDAFSCSHRAHASIVGIAEILKSCAGFLLENEIDNLQNLLTNPKKPLMAIVGGSKISTKIDLLNSLVKKAEMVFIAGAMANSFLYALGKNIGKSLCEKELKNTALEIIENAKKNNCQLILPTDLAVCKKLENNARCQIVSTDKVNEDDIIADIGPQTICNLITKISACKSLIWNGPLGAFEFQPFNIGSEFLARAIASQTKTEQLISIAGGGDVVAAINSAGLFDEFSYISTAGGAFLEWLEGKILPGIEAISE